MKRQLVGTEGLTLFEAMAVLMLTAVLAGVLLPSLTTWIRNGQVGRVVTDLNHLRASATAFFSDVNRYPGDMHDLANQIGATDTDARAASYPAKLIARWAGPYLDEGLADGDSLATGFGGSIGDDFTVSRSSSGVDYLTILATGISAAEFEMVDRALDAGDGAGAGRLRLTATGDTLKYHAVPLQ